MIYHDSVPKFIEEFCNTPSMQRIKNVGMDCGCEHTSFPIFSKLGPYSRYTHSLGVALIVYHFTGSMEQSLAGLFHDIATPCFSHTVDFLNGDHINQMSTESFTENIIREDGEISQLLAKYNVNVEDVLDYHKYPIADNDSPRLSADRLEYSLSNAVRFECASEEEVQAMYSDLTILTAEDGNVELGFKTETLAIKYANSALTCGKVYCCDEDRYSMQVLSMILKRAIEMGVIKYDDLYKDEIFLINQIESHPITNEMWTEFKKLREIRKIEPKKHYFEGLTIPAKKRFVDPLVMGKGRVSEICENFKNNVEEFKKTSQAERIYGIS